MLDRFSSRLTPGRALLALVLFEGTLALLVWSPFPAGIWHDDGVYVLLGRSLAEGDGLRYTGIAGAYPAPKFPPLYPLTLAGLWAVLPDLGSVTLWATVLNVVVLAAAAPVFAWLLHRRLGASPAVAVGISALAWLSIHLWRVALVPFSEPLFLLFLLLAMVIACEVERSVGRSGRREEEEGESFGEEDSIPLSRWIVLVALVLSAVHFRTVAIALVLALVASLTSGGRVREGVGFLAATVVGILPWTIWSAGATRSIPDFLQDVLGSYGSWILGQVAAFPGGYLIGLEGQARDLVDRLLTLLTPLPLAWEGAVGSYRWTALALLLPAFVLGLDRIWERSRTLVLFVVFYLAVVWLWPFQAMRLLAPIVPFLILIVAAGFWWRPKGGGPSRVGVDESPDVDVGRGTDRIGFHPRLLLAWRWAGAVWAAGFVAVSVWSMAEGATGAGYRIRSAALARSLEAVREATPDDAVIGAPELWAAVPLHTGRTATPSARFLPARPADRGPIWGTPSEQHAIWAEARVDYLILELGGTIHGPALDEVTGVCGPETARVRARWPEGILVELAWDEACRERLGI